MSSERCPSCNRSLAEVAYPPSRHVAECRAGEEHMERERKAKQEASDIIADSWGKEYR